MVSVLPPCDVIDHFAFQEPLVAVCIEIVYNMWQVAVEALADIQSTPGFELDVICLREMITNCELRLPAALTIPNM